MIVILIVVFLQNKNPLDECSQRNCEFNFLCNLLRHHMHGNISTLLFWYGAYVEKQQSNNSCLYIELDRISNEYSENGYRFHGVSEATESFAQWKSVHFVSQ